MRRVVAIGALYLALVGAFALRDWFDWRECLQANPWWYCARVM